MTATARIQAPIQRPPPATAVEGEAEVEAEVEEPESLPPTTTTSEARPQKNPLHSPTHDPPASAPAARPVETEGTATQPLLSPRSLLRRLRPNPAAPAPLPLFPTRTPVAPLFNLSFNAQFQDIARHLSDLRNEVRNLGRKIENIERESKGEKIGAMFGNVENIYLQGFEDFRSQKRRDVGGGGGGGRGGGEKRGEEDG